MTGSGVFDGLIVFVVSAVAATLLRSILARTFLRHGVRPDLALLVTRIVYFSLLGVGLFALIFLAIGLPYIAGNGVLLAAVLIGFGLQDLARNYVSGFYILLERHVKEGQHLESNGYSGIVTDVRWRVTYLRGEDGSLIVIPNDQLFSKPIVVRPAPP